MARAVFLRAAVPCIRVSLGVLATLQVAAGVTAVSAQETPLTEARALYLAAELEAARRILVDADSAGLPDREDYLSVLALRALVMHGLGDDDARDRDLERLALLAPERDLPDEAPPTLRERFSRIRERVEPVSLDVRTERTSDGVVVESALSADEHEIVDRVVLFARLSPDAPFRRGVDRVAVETTLAGVLEYHAEALSSGGTPVLTRGSAQEPLRFPFLAADPPENEDDSTGASPLPWILGGAGVAVATAIAIGIAIAVGGANKTFQVGGPALEGE